MENPLISIITVTFNADKEIAKTLQSLKQQTFGDFEHLIIDGGSKDDTLQIVENFSLPQTKVISEPDNGLYDAMNKGLRMATGKYVLFLNAGDIFHSKDTLDHYRSAAVNNPDIIYSDTIVVDREGKKISNRHLNVPEKLTVKSFSNGMLICHQAFMVKKSLAPNYNLTYRFSADYDWTINCIRNSDAAKCINLHTVGIDFLDNGMTEKNKWPSLKERFTIMKHHYGGALTIIKHIGFVFRALKRGKI